MKLFYYQPPRKYGTGLGSNSQPLDLQSEALSTMSLLTTLFGPGVFFLNKWITKLKVGTNMETCSSQ